MKAMARAARHQCERIGEVGDTMWARLTELSEKDPHALMRS